MSYEGTVTRFLKDRRFGFILYSEGEIFFHELDALSFTDTPQRGDKVSFEIGEFRGRAKAFNVTPVRNGASNESR